MRIPIRKYITLLSRYMRPQRTKVVVLGVLLFLQIGVQLANPQVLRVFIDSATGGAQFDALVQIAGLFIVFALAQQALVVAGTYLSQDVGWTATNELRAEVAEHCLGLDMAFHKTRTPGEWIERIDGDVTALANFFSQFVMLVLGNLLLLGGVIIVTWFQDWRIGLCLTAFTVFAFFALNRTRTVATPYYVASRQSHAILFGELEEHLAGLDDIRANSAGAFLSRRFAERQRDVYRTTMRAEMFSSVVDMVSTSCFALGYIGALVLGAWLYQNGQASLGMVFLVLRYTQMLREPMSQITRQLQDLQKASAGIVRISQLLALRPKLATSGRTFPHTGALGVEFDHVTFAYDDVRQSPPAPGENGSDERVLRDLDFRLQPGRILGLLGRTGSGKTTVARLLARLYDPTDGAIRLGGVDIRDAATPELRRAVGMVTQDVQMFHATLRQNLTLFDDTILEVKIRQALDELGLREWVDALPNGLDTMLASGGGLSAGEAQLLAFTRVMLTNPALIILDEASSRLDPATERLIERAVDRLLRNRTAIVIAHRLDTVQRADEILILEGGQIREQGAREALAANPGTRFAHLLQKGMEEVLV